MKQIQIAMLLSALAAGASLILSIVQGGTVWMLCSGATLVLLIWLCVISHKQAKVARLLLAENKELREQAASSADILAQADRETARSRISALQYQINPHFLYNTLDTIRGMALLQDQKDIAEMTERLSRYFRYAISNRENIVRVEEEIHYIEDYLYIQKKRFGDRFDTEIILEKPEISEYYMLKLTLQPLVENAISHGLEQMRSDGLVRISFLVTERKLLIHIEDNGVGMPPERLFQLNDSLKSTGVLLPREHGRHNGIAVRNVNTRIRLTFGEAYGLHYRSEAGNGTTVVVTMPLVDDFTRLQYTDRAV